MDHDGDGETSYNTFVDDVAFEPTYLQALLTAAGRNVATEKLSNILVKWSLGVIRTKRYENVPEFLKVMYNKP